ncbi:reverse transcriptase [Plakobranchus ocellatus]|uniref:Reverse transcriptase n=1 Tax=Plakobranchus ocellatus TaxID=259542 RepID=A0AAV4B4V8_9GAST|nr:reverse transcriptase [Plakobranchus ocellatus]
MPLEEIENLAWPSAPGVKFNNKLSTLDEVKAVVKKARDKPSPVPNALPYLLQKRCLDVFRWIHEILRSAWHTLKISEQWMTDDGVHIPKEQNSTEINQFRPISLLNVEGKKNFLSVMASRLTNSSPKMAM